MGGASGDQALRRSNQPTIARWTSISVSGALAGHALADELERAILDPIQPLGRGHVGRQRRVGPDRLEALREIAGGHDFDAAAARTASTVPASTRETYGIALPGEYSIATRRRPASSAFSPVASCSRPAYDSLLAGQRIEVVAFDRVHQASRLAGGRDR